LLGIGAEISVPLQGPIMGESRDPMPSGEGQDLEREIRADRKFSLSEAIGRMAGGDLMKGASPVTRKRQAELAIEDYLRRQMTDAGRVLGSVLLRRVGDRLLRDDYDQPLDILAEYIRQVLGSEYLLEDLVRDADMEWGRMFGERPYFQQAGRLPSADDPYTVDAGRITLSRLIEKLTVGEP
jgi:hypothetical protein